MARLRNNRWLGDVRTPDGMRHRLSFATQEQAEAWENFIRSAAYVGRPLPKPYAAIAGVRPGSEKLATLGPLYDHVKKTRWAGTKGEYERCKSALRAVEYFGRNKDIREITSPDIAEMRADMAATGLSTASVNRRCSALSTLLHTAKDAGVLAGVPNMHMKREEQTRFRYLDHNEEKLMLTYWRHSEAPEMEDLCIFLIDTGARTFSEGVSAPWEAFSKDGKSVSFWDTKTGKPRTLPLTQRARDAIAKRKKVTRAQRGPFTEINRDTLRARWDTMRRVLGFHDVTPYTLRHTCCTRLVLGGADVKRVMTWMGHSAIQTTMRYMQIRTTDLDSLLELLG